MPPIKAPIELNLYDDSDEPIKDLRRIIIPWGLAKKAVSISKSLRASDEIEADQVDAITDLVVEIFGEDKVSREELEKFADLSDMVSVIRAIEVRAFNLVPNPPPAAK
ncbi:MAG TPA: hypothetical protein DCG54_09750 [Anaerolineae bacterium]|jgi:hypothetical protein|nr:hypothetical protein [Anaerolineae bacterium]